MKKHNLKNDAMNEGELKRVYNYPIYPRGSKNYSVKGFVNLDKSRMGGTHWVCFIMKDNKSFYLDSFGGDRDKFLLNQIPKLIFYHNYKLNDLYSRLCGSCCLYVFHLMERMSL